MVLENYTDLVQTTWYPPQESEAGVLFRVLDETLKAPTPMGTTMSVSQQTIGNTVLSAWSSAR